MSPSAPSGITNASVKSDSDPSSEITGRVLVTGAAGFVGRALVAALGARGVPLVGTVRTERDAAGRHDLIAVGDLAATPWEPLLDGIATVVHLAAFAHRAGDEREIERGNVEGTLRLVRGAARAGVRRIVYVSSVKVNGEETTSRPFNEDDAPRPLDAYGRTKLAAEQVVASEAGRVETVVLRPPLVYGPGVRANFLALMRAVDRGVALPLASVRNARSLLSLGNLVSAIEIAMAHPSVAGGTFLLSDGADLSTPDLVRAIASALGRPTRLLPFPPSLLEAFGSLVGRRDAIRRLTRSLQVDARRFRETTGWVPPFGVAEGMAETAAWYRATDRGGAHRR